MSSDVTHIITIETHFLCYFRGSVMLDKIWTKYQINIHNLIHTWKMKIQWNSGISLDTLDSIEDIKHRNLSKDLPQS